MNDKNENETVAISVVETSAAAAETTTAKLEMPVVTTTSNLYDNNRTNDTSMHKNSNHMTVRYAHYNFVYPY